MSVLDKFLDAIRLNDDYDEDDEFFDEDDIEEEDEPKPKKRFFKKMARRKKLRQKHLLPARLNSPSSLRLPYLPRSLQCGRDPAQAPWKSA